MKYLLIIVVAILCFSFRPSTEKAASAASNGFYIYVRDNSDRTYHKYIVQSRDSVDVIFEQFFNSELDLGEIDFPLSIYNGYHDFYIARVNVYTKPNGELGFRNLKYPKIYNKENRKRGKLKPAIL